MSTPYRKKAVSVTAFNEVMIEDDNFPVAHPGTLLRNTSRGDLIEIAIERGEGRIASTGAFATETGQHTGRSAGDKFTIRDSETLDTVWWDNNKAMAPEQFGLLCKDFLAHADAKDLFIQDLWAGADPDHRLQTRIYCELAWHALFIQHMLIKPSDVERATFAPELTIVNLPSFRANPERHGTDTQTVIACNFSRRLVLIGGTHYAGEIKKSVFTYLNYLLPEKDVMPMHCSANISSNGDTAVFFGLSGTGKTTLSADSSRTLLGDDEHGWSDNGVYNFEGGCYAKTIRLSAATEPEIYAAVNRPGAVLENVVLMGKALEPNFDDGSLTENSRSAYPLEFIANASASGYSGHPNIIIMLTADAFGILPPIAKLTPSQAEYHFLSGYTAKVAGTEKGIEGVQATFSTCFGAPFMPRHPSVYGNLLRTLIDEHDVDCWLVNTGWTGGAYGVGHRMPIKVTRALLNAALSGTLSKAAFRLDPIFGFEVPEAVDGVNAAILEPRMTWDDRGAFDAQAKTLVGMFRDNFKIFEAHVDAQVRAAAPARPAD